MKLIYFDFNGGRGEACRLALHIAGIPFEDERIPLDDWPGMKDSTPFGQLPILEVDGERITQSNSINRYVGKLGGLYPEEPLEALRCDEPMDAVDDLMNKIVPTFFIEDDEQKRKARAELADGPIPVYLKSLGRILEDRGGEYFAGNRLTVADLKVFLFVRYMRSGMLDYVATDLPDTLAPNLVTHFERINAHPAIVDWYAAH
ncbi:MAG: glutathione S-transferase [Saprospiraceae bacterium]|nr:glutathione S-transferase [Saprospiraceae bacterium]